MLQTIDSALNLSKRVVTGPLSSFRAKAETDLANIRSEILIFLQDSSSLDDLEIVVNDLRTLRLGARSSGMEHIAEHSAECESVLTHILKHEGRSAEQSAHHALDLIAKIEASLFSAPLYDDLEFSISGFLDESFSRLTNSHSTVPVEAAQEFEGGFEIDEETMDIFRGEAAELLESITANLNALSTQSDHRDALWNIRRCAHTFKGAAGVIGLQGASELAHRVEDLLDRLAEDSSETTASIIDLLASSTDHLHSMTLGCGPQEHSKSLAEIHAEFDRVIADNAISLSIRNTIPPDRLTEEKSEINSAAPVKPPPAPIARVELDKLDELLNLTRDLAINRNALAAIFGSGVTKPSFKKIGSLFEEQRNITNHIQEKLLQIRMVRFGMLATRLSRAVHVTCQEENKKAELIIDNEDLELDTQMLDSLVEPLLHLLRNAVVHGIEEPERRRLIAKPEKGQIRICVERSVDEIVISVHDDGRGISTAKLLKKAIASGVIDEVSAEKLTNEEVLELIFSRGLTTAAKLSLNAGRGVGMSIVRESVGSTGGSVAVATESQRGTTFTIRIPVVSHPSFLDANEDDEYLFSMCEKSLRTGDQASGPTILVVDDSSSMRQLIKRIVEDTGLKCITATDGQNAVEILSIPENRPDLILTDLEMPNINGYELLEILKSDAEMMDIPVVMVTSRQDDAHRKKALDLGAVDFVTKPFDVNVLVEIIKHQCQIAEPVC